MRLIDELKGMKKNRNCLIVGGGMSAGRFDYSSIQGKSFDIIALNDSLYFKDGYSLIKPDYLVYSDGTFTRVLSKMNVANVDVIGYVNSPSPKMKYRFIKERLSRKIKDHHNVCIKALYIAQLMGYDEVYLIGIDLKAELVDGVITSHHQGDRIGNGDKYPDQERFNNHVKRLNDFIEQFNEIDDFENVFNLNQDSMLKKYKYKSIKNKTA